MAGEKKHEYSSGILFRCLQIWQSCRGSISSKSNCRNETSRIKKWLIRPQDRLLEDHFFFNIWFLFHIIKRKIMLKSTYTPSSCHVSLNTHWILSWVNIRGLSQCAKCIDFMFVLHKLWCDAIGPRMLKTCKMQTTISNLQN